MNEMVCEDILFSINGKTELVKVACNLFDKYVTGEQTCVNLKLYWKHLVHKYAPNMAPYYIQLKRDFSNIKFDYSNSNPDEWVTDIDIYVHRCE